MMQKIEKYLNQNKTSSFKELLFNFIDKKGLKVCEVYKKVAIDRRLFSKIRCNENYIPKKDNWHASVRTLIILSLELSLKEEKIFET